MVLVEMRTRATRPVSGRVCNGGGVKESLCNEDVSVLDTYVLIFFRCFRVSNSASLEHSLYIV